MCDSDVGENKNEYRRLLKKINDLRAIVGTEIQLPQICVIGDRNSGKIHFQNL